MPNAYCAPSGADYIPPSAIFSAKTTGIRWEHEGEDLSRAAMRRVDRATELLTGEKCLIENTLETNHVEYAHCLSESTQPKLLSKLEFAWNMQWKTLNVDTRQNIIRLSPKYHRAFDANNWLLLPEADILKKYQDATNTREFPIINDGVYKYRLVAQSRMQDVPIHRQEKPSLGYPLRPSEEDFAYYSYPYHNFPLISSHVHPKFVICNSGLKLTRNLGPWFAEDGSLDDALLSVLTIWGSWSSSTPGDDFLRMTPDDDKMSDNDSHTTSRCRSTRMLDTRATVMGDYWHKSVDNGIWLDGKTLKMFNQQTLPCADSVGVEEQLVLDWLKGVADSVFNSRSDAGLED